MKHYDILGNKALRTEDTVMKKQITTREAAVELGVSVRRVIALIAAGRLKARKHGRDYVIHIRDLDAVRVRVSGRPRK